MAILDYITIVLFLIGVLIAGLSFSKKSKNMTSFFAADGNIPWWIGGLSLFMGFFSAGTFVVWGSIAYSYGWVAITIQMCMCVAGFAVAFFIAPRWKHTRVLTVAEYITNRLSLSTQKIYTYLFLLVSLFTTGAFLYPVAKIVEVSTGLSLQLCILLLGGISILYVAAGGLWAVVITDVLQFVILTTAVLIVVPLSFEKVGGIGEFFANAPTDFFAWTNGEYTWLFVLAFCIYNTFFLGGNWSYVQRYTSVRTEKDARKVGLLFGSLYVICPLLWMLPPMIYRVYNGDLVGLADEGAYLMMCKEALPKGFLGLMLGGMVFATASSLNGALNISAGVFTNDIYKRIFTKSTDKQLIRVARWSTIGFGILAVIVALLIPYMGGIVNVVISLGALTGVPLYLPVIWTLFSKRQNKFTVLFTTLFSLFVNLVFKFITPALGLTLNREWEMLVGVLTPIVILSIFEVYLYIVHYTDSNVGKFKLLIEKQLHVDEEQLVKQADNAFGLSVVGIGIGLSGILIALLGSIASAQGNVHWIIYLMAALLLGVGILFYCKSKK